jgi:SnoaL-like domain
MTGATTTFDDLARSYIEAWNQSDLEKLRMAVDELFSPDVRYVDPMLDIEGREALVATITAVQEQFPGFAFRLAGPVDGHHDQARFRWELGPEGVDAPIVGFDVAVTDGAGRIRQVHGFLDQVPTG